MALTPLLSMRKTGGQFPIPKHQIPCDCDMADWVVYLTMQPPVRMNGKGNIIKSMKNRIRTSIWTEWRII
jgi:hypothetical protein